MSTSIRLVGTTGSEQALIREKAMKAMKSYLRKAKESYETLRIESLGKLRKAK